MVDDILGARLNSSGWQQGVLLPPLPYSVIYQYDNPISKIAKTAKKQSERKNISSSIDLPLHGIGVASGTRYGDYLVIASQDCDIVRSLSDKPNVICLCAFITDNSDILRFADSNSTRYFLLNRKRGLVAESTIMVLIEKPVLMAYTPETGALDSLQKSGLPAG